MDLIRRNSESSHAGRSCVILVVSKGASFDVSRIYSSGNEAVSGFVEFDAEHPNLFLDQVRTHYQAYEQVETTMRQRQRLAAERNASSDGGKSCVLM